MAINIPLVDGFRIRSDPHNFILAKHENGRDVSKSFHNDIKGCVKALIDRKIKGFDATSVHSLIECIKALETRLNRALQPLNMKVVSEKGGKK